MTAFVTHTWPVHLVTWLNLWSPWVLSRNRPSEQNPSYRTKAKICSRMFTSILIGFSLGNYRKHQTESPSLYAGPGL